MKKLSCIVIAMLLLVSGCSKERKAEETQVDFQIAASFYPVYITALNIAGNVDGVAVKSLVGTQTGCLHDYTLTVEEMKIAEQSDALIVNGAGMEPFIGKISANIPKLEIIDASENVEKISTDGEENPHVWLDAQNTIKQAETITDALCSLRPEYAGAFRANLGTYIAKLEELDEELKDNLKSVSGAKLVTFHEAFEYFADAYGLEVAAAIVRDENTAPSPKEIEEIISVMEENDIKAVFSEAQYKDSVVDTVAQAAGAQIYELDPVVGGEEEPEAYIEAMRKNAQVLLEALE